MFPCLINVLWKSWQFYLIYYYYLLRKSFVWVFCLSFSKSFFQFLFLFLVSLLLSHLILIVCVHTVYLSRFSSFFFRSLLLKNTDRIWLKRKERQTARKWLTMILLWFVTRLENDYLWFYCEKEKTFVKHKLTKPLK